MSPSPPADAREVLGALERLVQRHRVVSMDDAKRAARLLMNDPAFEFPPPKAVAPAEPVPPGAPPADAGASDNGGGSAP